MYYLNLYKVGNKKVYISCYLQTNIVMYDNKIVYITRVLFSTLKKCTFFTC